MPFVNIFIPIEEDDLFSKDFIINIPVPSNYSISQNNVPIAAVFLV